PSPELLAEERVNVVGQLRGRFEPPFDALLCGLSHRVSRVALPAVLVDERIPADDPPDHKCPDIGSLHKRVLAVTVHRDACRCACLGFGQARTAAFTAAPGSSPLREP